jgi:hypothetical protein
MKSLFVRVVLPLLTLLLLSVPANATTVLRISLEKMTQASDLIVYAEVLSAEPVAVEGNPRHIRTDVRLRVIQRLKGSPQTGQNLVLELPGGRLGDYGMHVPGMPSFRAGEEVVLFLEKTAVNWALTGLGQGKFSVVVDSNRHRTVRRSFGGLHFMGFDAEGRFQEMSAPVDPPSLPLQTLLERVRTILKAAQENGS